MTPPKPPDRWVVWTCEGDGNNSMTLLSPDEEGADHAARTHITRWLGYVAYVGHITWKRVYRPADPLVVACDVEQEEMEAQPQPPLTLCPGGGVPAPVGAVVALSGKATAFCEVCRAHVPFTLDGRYVAHPYTPPKAPPPEPQS